MIALVRIDDRLVHGQVVEGWLPAVKAGLVAVVSDQAAGDATQQALMRMALPEDVGLRVLAVKDAPAFLAGPDAAAARVLVLAAGPGEVLALLEAGAGFEAVNVGGLHYSAGWVQLGRMIFLSEEDRAALKAILARGVRLEGQAVPSDAKADLGELL